jgi:hypothetical protein
MKWSPRCLVIPVVEAKSAAAIALGLFSFALLCGIGLAAGLGLLALLRFPRHPVRRLLLAPFAITAAWALTGNLLVRFGLTMSQVTPAVGFLSIGLAALGIAWAARIRLRPGLVATLAGGPALLVILLCWPYFVRGLTAHLGSGNLDTAYYTTTASAYWHYGLDATSAASPFFQHYAPVFKALGSARNHTYVLLAFFSPLVQAGEPVFVRNLFVCWSLFVLACSLAFYRTSWTMPGVEPETSARDIIGYAGVTVGIGWAVVPALVGNWDNGLFVSLGPVLAGMAVEPPRGYAYPLFLGATLAYGVYTYPELVPMLVVFLAPHYLPGVWERATRAHTLRVYALVASMAAALVAPGVKPLWHFFRGQVIGARGGRPGGRFAAGLAEAPFDPSAWWALGAEHAAHLALSWSSVVGLLLSVLALAGAIRLARRGKWAEICSLSLVVTSLGYFVLVARYGYAGYKILSISWWLIGRCLVEGAASAVSTARAYRGDRWSRRAVPVVAVGALAVLLLGALVVAERSRLDTYFPRWVFKRQPTLAALARLRQAAKGQPPTDVLVVYPFTDHFVLPWIIYALKDTPLRPYHDPDLTPPIPGGIGWSMDGPLPETVLLSVRDLPDLTPRFRTPEFALADFEAVPFIEHIDNPNGLENWGTWLGTKPIRISFLARRGLRVTLSFEAAPGPSLPESARRTLVLSDGARDIGRVQMDGPGTAVFTFLTRAGRNVMTLSTPDTPSVKVMPNGDPRPLLVSIRDLKLAPAPSGPAP